MKGIGIKRTKITRTFPTGAGMGSLFGAIFQQAAEDSTNELIKDLVVKLRIEGASEEYINSSLTEPEVSKLIRELITQETDDWPKGYLRTKKAIRKFVDAKVMLYIERSKVSEVP